MATSERTAFLGKVGLKPLVAVAGALLTVVLVSTAFFRWNFGGPGPLVSPRFSFAEFGREIPRHLGWLLPFALLTAAIIPLRALQWQRTLDRRVPFKERYHLVAIGAFCNNALPGKLGDVIRAFLMSRSQRLSFLRSLGSVLVCKLLEFAALMLLVALSFLGPFGEAMARFSGVLRVAVALCLGLVVGVVLLAHFARPLSRVLERRGLPRLRGILVEIGEGLGAARSFRGIALALLLSVGPVLAPSLAYGLGLRGLGIPGGMFAGAVVLGAIAFGQTAIGVPAGMGIYYFVTSWAARSLGATAEQAAAYSALTHMVTVGTFVAVGAVSFWLRKLRWSDLKRRGTQLAELASRADGDEPERAT